MDLFTTRVANLAGLTVRRLREHQRMLTSIGLGAQAEALEPLVREHETVAFDCCEDTAVR